MTGPAVSGGPAWIPVHADGTDCAHGVDPAEFGDFSTDAYEVLGVPRIEWTPPKPRCRGGVPLRGVRDPRIPPAPPEPAEEQPGVSLPRTPAGFAHAEAFCVMRYVADDGTDEEFVFNSRDGVTPFVIRLRSGKTASHADWSADRRMPPGWVPPPGMRSFTDLTPERARAYAEQNIDAWLADEEGRARVGDDRDAAVTALAESYLAQPGAPDIYDPQEAR